MHRNHRVSTENRTLYLSEKFSEIGFHLPSKECFGLGQRNGKFRLSPGYYTMYPRTRVSGLRQDDGMGDNNGNHIIPFLMCLVEGQSSTKAFGFLFVSSAPMVFEILDTTGQGYVLNYITLGGPIEFLTFSNYSPH